MTTILGIDAAWTPRNPSGVALVQQRGADWTCLAVTPSYRSFLQLADGHPVDWNARPVASAPDPDSLLLAARTLAGEDVNVVTIDMPIATVRFAGRRVAENEVSRRFGARGCSTHSSTADRPGALGSTLAADFASLGYPIATQTTAAGTDKRLVEVYPHLALLALLGQATRFPYKQSRSTKLWPGASINERVDNLLSAYAAIENALAKQIEGVSLRLPATGSGTTLSHLKRYEDALDALVACWVGTLYMTRKASPLGDETGAIWCPTEVLDLGPLETH